MLKTYKILIVLGFAGLASAQTPSILPNGIVNVASYAYAGLPSGGIAPGSMFVAFGSNLGPATLVQSTAFPLGTTLGGTSVKITAGGKTFDAPLNYSLAGQITGILPSTVPAGSATMTVTYNGATSAPQSFTVSANSFGTFATNSGGSGPGSITSVAGKVFTATTAANPNEVAVIYGTGLGAINGNDSAKPSAADLTNIPVEVYVGSVKATITYRGRTDCCAAIDQINFTVPANAAGCSVPVVVKINSVISNTTTMPIAPSGSRTCSDPGGPSNSTLASINSKGIANIGAVALSRSTTTIALPVQIPGFDSNFNADVGVGTFTRFTQAQLNASNNPFSAPAMGSCSVQWTKGGNVAATAVIPQSLDAGASISVKGPNGTTALTKATAGGQTSYGAVFGSSVTTSSNFLNPGTFTISGGGGSDVGAFSAVLNLSAPVTWSNKDSISSVNRAGGQVITWGGGDAGTTVLIGGGSANGSDPDSVGANFNCYAKASDGTFTIPASVLLSLPPSVAVQGVEVAFLYVGSYTAPVSFTASGLDYGVAVATTTALKTLGYK